jgi:tRNA pseudouridine55 synthase
MQKQLSTDYQFKREKDLSDNTAGIFLIDKPTGITSHDVVDKVRLITGIRRVGHTGTLDPLATGLLIILVGREFTKLQVQFLKQDKEYICQAKLGVQTDSYDIDGQVIKKVDWKEVEKISHDRLKKTLKKFRGEILQTVPAFSAVKVKGQKLYQKARKGEIKQKELPQRQVNIKKLQLIKFEKKEADKETTFTIDIECSSGTYIRSLVHDIGQQLEVGATVISLRRIKIGKIEL